MKHLLKTYRKSIFVVGGVSIVSMAGLLATYVDARQQVEVSNSIAQQRAEATDELLALRQKQIKLEQEQKAKAEAEKAKKAAEEAKSSPTQTEATSVALSAGSSASHRNPKSIDVIVNKKHPLIPLGFTPSLQTVSCAGNGSATISVNAVSDFKALCKAASAAGAPVAVSSGFRSYATQVSTYSYWVSISGQSGADTYSARPGYSEHQTGLAADFMVPGGARLSDFTGTKQQKWLAANAWKYGFIQRYTTSNSSITGYSAESWHYRYIGRSAAKSYISQNVSSLEQYWGVPGGGY